MVQKVVRSSRTDSEQERNIFSFAIKLTHILFSNQNNLQMTENENENVYIHFPFEERFVNEIFCEPFRAKNGLKSRSFCRTGFRTRTKFFFRSPHDVNAFSEVLFNETSKYLNVWIYSVNLKSNNYSKVLKIYNMETMNKFKKLLHDYAL